MARTDEKQGHVHCLHQVVERVALAEQVLTEAIERFGSLDQEHHEADETQERQLAEERVQHGFHIAPGAFEQGLLPKVEHNPERHQHCGNHKHGRCTLKQADAVVAIVQQAPCGTRCSMQRRHDGNSIPSFLGKPCVARGKRPDDNGGASCHNADEQLREAPSPRSCQPPTASSPLSRPTPKPIVCRR